MKTPLPLLFALIMNGAGHAYFAISLPAIGRIYAISDFNISIILSLSALLLMITGPIWGWLCDKIGRQKVLIIGLVSSALSAFATAITIDYSTLFSAHVIALLLLNIRMIHAALSAGLKPAIQAIVADITPEDSRIKGMGLMGATFGLGTIGGGIVAMLSGTQYLTSGFVLLGSLMLISSAWAYFSIPETRPNINIEEASCSTWPWRPVAGYLITTLIGLTIYSALQPITHWRLHDLYSLNTHQALRFTGATMMSSMLAMVIAQAVLVRQRKITPNTWRLSGLSLTAFALILCSLAPNAIALLLAMAIMGLGLGVLLPANLALMSLATSKDQQGKIAGLNGMCQGLGMTIGPLLGTITYQINGELPYYLASSLITLLGLHTLFHRAHEKRIVTNPR